MARTININFRMEENLKKNMEMICNEMGLSMTTAFTIFAKKVVREQKIPFEISAVPFHYEEKIKILDDKKEQIIQNIETLD